jgi:hypothetical protein
LTGGRAAQTLLPVHAPNHPSRPTGFTPDSRQAWVRLVLALLIGSVGAVGMWSVVVVIPVVQAEFGATRGAVSLAFTLTMFGFGLGGVIAGKITDRFGIVPAMAISICFLVVANVLAGLSTMLWQFVAVYFLIGLGTSATFAPLMAEASHWFERYRGLAVTIVASGNYVAGTIWPPIVSFGIEAIGWRMTHIALGIVCASAMTVLVLMLRAQMGDAAVSDHTNAPPPRVDLKLSTNTLTALLSIASIACCVAMAMPQVGARRRDALADDGLRHRQPDRVRLPRRQDRRHPDAADRIAGAGLCAGVLPVLRQPELALPDLGDVRPVPGRHRAELCDHRARGDAGVPGGDAGRHRDLRVGVRHVLRRLGVGRDLRCDRLLCGGLRQRRGVECAQCRHRGDAADPLAHERHADGSGLCDLMLARLTDCHEDAGAVPWHCRRTA